MYDFVQSAVYSCHARHENGAENESAIDFCVESEIDAVLQRATPAREARSSEGRVLETADAFLDDKADRLWKLGN